MTIEQKRNAAIAKATALSVALNTAIDSGLWDHTKDLKIMNEGDIGPQRYGYSFHSQFKGVLNFIPDENGIEKAEVDEESIIEKIQKQWN